MMQLWAAQTTALNLEEPQKCLVHVWGNIRRIFEIGTALGCLENVPTIFGVKIPSPTIESQKDV